MKSPFNSSSPLSKMKDGVDDDPLEIKDLSVKYDYLIYKINDHIANLADITHQSVTTKRKLIDEQYFDHQLRLDDQLKDADRLIQECTELETLFMKLDQLYMFVGEFKKRMTVLEQEFEQL